MNEWSSLVLFNQTTVSYALRSPVLWIFQRNSQCSGLWLEWVVDSGGSGTPGNCGEYRPDTERETVRSDRDKEYDRQVINERLPVSRQRSSRMRKEVQVQKLRSWSKLIFSHRIIGSAFSALRNPWLFLARLATKID